MPDDKSLRILLLYSGVLLALKHFCKMGIPLGICTSKPTGSAKEICARLDLIQFFDCIYWSRDRLAQKTRSDIFTAQNCSVPFRLFANSYLNEPLPDLSKADRFEDWDSHGILVD
jgi:phosphoglycolate phosphatase